MPWMFIANPEQPLHPHQPTFLRQVNPSRSVADGRRAQIKSLRCPSQSHCPSPRGGFLHRHARRSGRDCTLLRWTSASRPDTCGGAATWEHKRGENKSTRHGGLYSSGQKVRKQFGTSQVFKGGCCTVVEDEAQIRPQRWWEVMILSWLLSAAKHVLHCSASEPCSWAALSWGRSFNIQEIGKLISKHWPLGASRSFF